MEPSSWRGHSQTKDCLYHSPHPLESWPFQAHITTDLIINLPISKGNTVIIVVINRFSKSLCLIPQCGLPTSFETTKLIFNHEFSYFGIPEDIANDSSTQFTSWVWSSFKEKPRVPVSLTSVTTCKPTVRWRGQPKYPKVLLLRDLELCFPECTMAYYHAHIQHTLSYAYSHLTSDHKYTCL